METDNINIRSHSNGIVIETKDALLVTIYNLSGQKIYESFISGNTDIRLGKGVYVVRANNGRVKVIVP